MVGRGCFELLQTDMGAASQHDRFDDNCIEFQRGRVTMHLETLGQIPHEDNVWLWHIPSHSLSPQHYISPWTHVNSDGQNIIARVEATRLVLRDGECAAKQTLRVTTRIQMIPLCFQVFSLYYTKGASGKLVSAYFLVS